MAAIWGPILEQRGAKAADYTIACRTKPVGGGLEVRGGGPKFSTSYGKITATSNQFGRSQTERQM